MTKNELEEILEKENLLSIYISDEKMQKRYAKYEDSINHQNIYGIRWGCLTRKKTACSKTPTATANSIPTGAV